MAMMGAKGDTVAPFVPDKVRRVGNPHVRVIEIDANHVDPCFDPLFPSCAGPTVEVSASMSL